MSLRVERIFVVAPLALALLASCGSAHEAAQGTSASPPQRCGGNVRDPPRCPDGYRCVPDPARPDLPFGDVGGICVPDPGR